MAFAAAASLGVRGWRVGEGGLLGFGQGGNTIGCH